MNRVIIKRKKEKYYIEEAFKSLRTNIQFCGEDKKVIAFTSAIPGEGKSSVSLNLAVSLAEAGKKVLFIDADLRKSVLTGTVEINEKISGLTHFLAKQATLQEIINSTNVPDLYLIMAGPVPPNPAELLGRAIFNEMLEIARKVYDYIIVDTPPLGSVIDSAIIAERCDGAVLVIESGVVSYRFVQNIKKQLDKSNCPILGTVINKAEHSQSGRYGQQYGKYSFEGRGR